MDHPFPSEPQHSPYKHAPIIYGAKVQYAAASDDSLALDKDGITRVQTIIGVLLYCARAVDNKLFVALSELGQQQAAATEATNDAFDQLINFVATYPPTAPAAWFTQPTLAPHTSVSAKLAVALEPISCCLRTFPFPATMGQS